MPNQFELLFSPLQIRNKTVKNRIVSTAHVTVFTEDGMPAERERRYYVEKAKGGAGMLIGFGSSSVHPTSPALDWRVVEMFDDRVAPARVAHEERFGIAGSPPVDVAAELFADGAMIVNLAVSHEDIAGRRVVHWLRARG